MKADDGSTPLHKACLNKSYEVSKLLLKKGANKEAKTDKEKTPLQLAIEKDYKDIIKLFDKDEN